MALLAALRDGDPHVGEAAATAACLRSAAGTADRAVAAATSPVGIPVTVCVRVAAWHLPSSPDFRLSRLACVGTRPPLAAWLCALAPVFAAVAARLAVRVAPGFARLAAGLALVAPVVRPPAWLCALAPVFVDASGRPPGCARWRRSSRPVCLPPGCACWHRFVAQRRPPGVVGAGLRGRSPPAWLCALAPVFEAASPPAWPCALAPPPCCGAELPPASVLPPSLACALDGAGVLDASTGRSGRRWAGRVCAGRDMRCGVGFRLRFAVAVVRVPRTCLCRSGCGNSKGGAERQQCYRQRSRTFPDIGLCAWNGFVVVRSFAGHGASCGESIGPSETGQWRRVAQPPAFDAAWASTVVEVRASLLLARDGDSFSSGPYYLWTPPFVALGTTAAKGQHALSVAPHDDRRRLVTGSGHRVSNET